MALCRKLQRWGELTDLSWVKGDEYIVDWLKQFDIKVAFEKRIEIKNYYGFLAHFGLLSQIINSLINAYVIKTPEFYYTRIRLKMEKEFIQRKRYLS